MGFEPTPSRLRSECSTTELLGHKHNKIFKFFNIFTIVGKGQLSKKEEGPPTKKALCRKTHTERYGNGTETKLVVE